MTGPEHYREAERLLRDAPGDGKPIPTQMIAEAQVHATLALTAAIIDVRGVENDTVAWTEATS